MKTRSTVLTLIVLFVGMVMCFAANASLGTWKLNQAKSKLSPGLPKNLTVTYEAVGNDIKATVDGVDGQGQPTHSEWTGKFDGKDYPVTGDPTSDARAIKQIDDRNLQLTVKKDGKVTMSGQIVISADGKSRTLTMSGTDAAGKKVKSTSLYEKQ